jgi:uncharacterized protein (DUF1499 family)
LRNAIMSLFTWLTVIAAALALLVLAAGQLGWLQGSPPGDLGVRDGRLKPPSATANSVSSQAGLYPGHPQRQYADIAPLAVRGDGAATLVRIRTIVEAMAGARVVTDRPDYLHVQFTTRWLRFVDDAEFWFDPVNRVIQVRSASRIGRGDLGVNRRRIEKIRSMLETGR